MGKYAVIRIQGHQYRVEEKETLLVDKVKEDINPEVLLVASEDKIEVGKPVCEKAKVKIIKQEDQKGEKIYVSKYKAKSRYRKKIGHRTHLTKIFIDKISP